MNIKDLVFHIHYCKGRKFNKPSQFSGKITRTISHHELALVTGGKGRIIVEKKSYPVQEGMLFYLRPDILHSIESDSLDPASFLTVHFDYAHVTFQDNVWVIKRATEMLPLQSVHELTDYYQVEEIFKKLVDSWDAKLPGYEFMTRTLFQQLLIAIYQNLRKQTQNYATSLKIEKIIGYMQQKITGRVTLNELSELVQLSTTYLSRTFKETTGYSIVEFFNKLKIEKSKELMHEGHKKIKEIAHSLGFSDQFYFSRIFKRLEGISPSEYYSKNVHGI